MGLVIPTLPWTTIDPETQGYAGAPRPQDCLWGQQIRLVDDRLIAQYKSEKQTATGGKERSPKIKGHEHAPKKNNDSAKSQTKDMDDQELPMLELSAFVTPQTLVQQAHLMGSTEDPELEI